MVDRRRLGPTAPKLVRAPSSHARESGHPDLTARAGALDSRLRGNDTTFNSIRRSGLATNMVRSASAAIERSQFDGFLFASIGQERNGMLLSVLSALARLDIDPWAEAASLARVSTEAAIERMRLWIVSLPEQSSLSSDPEAIAARLIALLPPRHYISKPTSIRNTPGRTLVVTINWRVLAFFILIGFMLGVQMLTRSIQPPAEADGGHGSTPSVARAPSPSQ